MHSTPTLVLVVGLPGTGKSTLTAALARELGWPVLDKDVLGDVLLEGQLPQTQAAQLAYKLLFRLAEAFVVEQGQSVFVESAGRQPFILEWARALTTRSGAKLTLIRCVAPAATRAERLATRTPGPSQWTHNQATDEDQEQWYAHLPQDALVLQTDKPLGEMVAYALTVLKR